MITFEKDAEIAQLMQQQLEIYESIVDWKNIPEDTIKTLKLLKENIQILLDKYDLVWKENP